jgi:hypothetical protein
MTPSPHPPVAGPKHPVLHGDAVTALQILSLEKYGMPACNACRTPDPEAEFVPAYGMVMCPGCRHHRPLTP